MLGRAVFSTSDEAGRFLLRIGLDIEHEPSVAYVIDPRTRERVGHFDPMHRAIFSYRSEIQDKIDGEYARMNGENSKA